ncbi:hypothetical protein G3T36_18105 [Diaminobutyricibacter tongyongensis]|uniref:Uncharacterized protein n=1 Tax=Leifsonia tongyongensis TaxID=1268043 RepID=A0A6L9Y2A6_9MICO|nr:hypothetical protein [Diaminobutyricibacter tongyongensis]NEN07773.1 hypothetical protein [Diaminobutyricibacter tongyongensis]
MSDHTKNSSPESGGPIGAEDIERAITVGELVYEDGSTQVFLPDGRTTYVERGRPTDGEWYVDDQGKFWSFWPPSYRASYDLEWVVEAGKFIGVLFRDANTGSVSTGRYKQ